MRKIMFCEGLHDRSAVPIFVQFEGIPPRARASNRHITSHVLRPGDELVIGMTIRQRRIAEILDPAPTLLLKRRPGLGILMGRAYLLDDWDGGALRRRGIDPVARWSGRLLGWEVRGDDRGV